MDGNLVAVISLLTINIGAVAYSYGKLSQKVNDTCRRLKRLEKILNHNGGR